MMYNDNAFLFGGGLMLNALLLCCTVVGISAQGILKKYYNVKLGGRGAFVFSTMQVVFCCLIFLFTSRFNLEFNAALLPYSIGFALSYGSAVIFGFLAIKTGALSITSLITSYSLVVPTFYGLFFLGEAVDGFFWVGFVLLIFSLFLINSRGGEIRITPIWIIYVTLAFLGNGICSAVQAAQQRAFAGAYKSEFMIMALVGVAICLAVIAVICERGDAGVCMRRGGHLMAACGISNGLVNLFVMILVTLMSAALMYPIMSAGGIILSWTVSRFLYKERLTRGQNLALVLGILSVIFMNL